MSVLSIFTDIQLKVIKFLTSKELDKQEKDKEPNEKNIYGLKGIITSIDFANESNRGDDEYDLGFALNDDEKRNYEFLMDSSMSIIREYEKTKGQMSLMYQFDDLKKDASVILAMMGDMKASLCTNVDFAKNKLKMIQARIVEEIIKEQKTSNAVAERKALIDSRLIIANEQYRLYSMYAAKIKARYETFCDAYQSIIQSVATARVGMIRDSYQDNGGKYVPEY